jgi:hypothetical protein
MVNIVVTEFAWDDENEDKIAFHGLRSRDVDTVLYYPYIVDLNRMDQRAPYLLIGRNDHGACIAVPIEKTDEPTIWRPVTAWRCKRSEWARLRQVRRRE